VPYFKLEMGKNPKFWVRVRFDFLDDKGSVRFGSVRFGSGSEHFKQQVRVRFVFCKRMVRIRVRFRFRFLHIFITFWFWLGSWQNLGSDSVRCCWVRGFLPVPSLNITVFALTYPDGEAYFGFGFVYLRRFDGCQFGCELQVLGHELVAGGGVVVVDVLTIVDVVVVVFRSLEVYVSPRGCPVVLLFWVARGRRRGLVAFHRESVDAVEDVKVETAEVA